jgi:hypothetical protein
MKASLGCFNLVYVGPPSGQSLLEGQWFDPALQVVGPTTLLLGWIVDNVIDFVAGIPESFADCSDRERAKMLDCDSVRDDRYLDGGRVGIEFRQGCLDV